MVDRALLAAKIATVRDAIARIRSVLPPDAGVFKEDRSAREIVILNLFVALQTCLDLAAHWLADEGWNVPQRYPDLFLALAEHGVLPRDLATRLAAASGLRNLVAHQYGVLDWARIHAIASFELDDLERYCAEIARRAH